MLRPPERLEAAAWDELLPVLRGEHKGWGFPPGFSELV